MARWCLFPGIRRLSGQEIWTGVSKNSSSELNRCLSSSWDIIQPGCTLQSIEGALNRSDPVESANHRRQTIICSCRPSHPGPVVGVWGRVSRPVLAGNTTSTNTAINTLHLRDSSIIPELNAVAHHATEPSFLTSSQPRRTIESFLEAPEPINPVPLGVTVQHSRLGPAIDGCDGVFQTACLGKYNLDFEFTLCDDSSHYPSQPVDRTINTDAQLVSSSSFDNGSSTSGRIVEGLWEAPRLSDCVLPPAASVHLSRPGPTVRSSEGVSQPAISGEYPLQSNISLVDAPSSSSIQRCTMSQTTSDLRIYYQNVRGLRTKIDDFFLAVSEKEYDVVVLTETWLDDVIYSSQLFANDYTVFRTDRSALNSRKSRGGGVLVAVSSRFSCSRESAAFSNALEQLWVRLDMRRYIISIGVFYLPPNRKNNFEDIQLHVDSIGAVSSRLGTNDIALVFGDYNQSAIRWSSANAYPTVDLERSRLSTASSALFDGFSFHGLTQINHVENPRGRILDLVLANDMALANCTIRPADEPLSVIDVDHPPLTLDLSCITPVTYDSGLDAQSYNFRKADYNALNHALLAIDWSFINSSRNVDEAVEIFAATISHAIDAHVPLVGPVRKPAWSNNKLRKLKRRRSAALRRYCNYRSIHNKFQFNLASREYRSYNQFLYSRYIIRTQRNLRQNPKQFWSFVKSKRNEDGLPTSMFLGNQSADTAADKCELFATQFKTAFNNFVVLPAQTDSAVRDIPVDVFDFDIFRISEQAVAKAIRKLKFSTSAGPDGIPSALLKRCCSALLEPLASIFNLSFRERTFPSSWKSSYLFPVHKKGSKRDMNNYRGITTLSACSKVFEIIVNDVLFTSCKHYISTDQHGFFPKRSVSSNLAQFTSTCIQAADSGKQVDAIYLDLKAAFDRVDHRILLRKLEKMGVSRAAVDWFCSYLIDRSLRVKIASFYSEPFVSTSGVPQGSNLGPLLFSLFINDVSLVLPPGVRLFYADDAKIYVIVNSFYDCLELQTLLNCFAEWCARNRLTLSIEKCQVITYCRKLNPILFDYTLSGIALDRVHRIRDLGVLLDDKLTFRFHYNEVISKANRQLGFITKIANGFNDLHCLRSLYCALVRSILEFAVIVWCPYQTTWINRFESVQKRFVRFALRTLPWRNGQQFTPYEDRCRLLELDTLEDRRCVAQAMYVSKILNNLVDSPSLLDAVNLYAPERHLRRRYLLQLGSRNSRYGQHDPIRFMSATFNEVSHLFDFDVPISTLQRLFTAYFRNAG